VGAKVFVMCIWLVAFVVIWSLVFSVPQHSILSPARPSVTRVDHTKTVEVRIIKFLPYSSPIPLVFVR